MVTLCLSKIVGLIVWVHNVYETKYNQNNLLAIVVPIIFVWRDNRDKQYTSSRK